MSRCLNLKIIKKMSKPLVMTAVLLAGIGLIFTGWRLSSANSDSAAALASKNPQIDLRQSSPTLPTHIYKQKIVPLINTYDHRNHQASARAIKSIKLSF